MLSIDIYPLTASWLSAAGGLALKALQAERQAVPLMPEVFPIEASIARFVAEASAEQRGLVAVQQGKLVGYLSWFIVDKFRNAPRRVAYVPVLGHSAQSGLEKRVYPALYRQAAEIWQAEGCNGHAISIFANATESLQTWFWQGFGMIVVDAIREMRPLGVEKLAGLTIRRAGTRDVDLLARLESEHIQHYAQAPILMAPSAPDLAAQFETLLKTDNYSAWLAEKDGTPLGYLRLESASEGATEVISSPDGMAITGLYVRPVGRGLGVGRALLDAALEHYAGLGFAHCSVDFESINPEATAFWPRFFIPVIYSLMRIPEI